MIQLCLPDSKELEERELKGFRIRICYEPELETTGTSGFLVETTTERLGKLDDKLGEHGEWLEIII